MVMATTIIISTTDINLMLYLLYFERARVS
jgi:hypothetical protein